MFVRCRRWYQFRLRTLLIGLSLPLGYVAHQAKIVRERKEFLESVRDNGRGYQVDGRGSDLPFVRRVLGDVSIRHIFLTSPTKLREIEFLRLFPESGVDVIGGYNPD